MNSIQSVAIGKGLFESRWGVVVNDYHYRGESNWTDFEWLMIHAARNRATSVEGEISPMSTVVRNRNARLQELGDALASLSKAQTTFADSDAGSKKLSEKDGSPLSSTVVGIINQLEDGTIVADATKAQVEKAIQLVKSQIDRLNNDAQRDITRLQSLIDRRDESFNMASSLMDEISGARKTTINNVG